MSHYTPIKVVIKDIDAAYDALVTLGFKPEQIERHAAPQVLHDYLGLDSGLRAHLIVRRQHLGLGNVHNDLGVRVGAQDGALYVCDYAKKKLGADWESRFKREYAVHMAKRDAKARGKTCVVHREKNTIRVFVSA